MSTERPEGWYWVRLDEDNVFPERNEPAHWEGGCWWVIAMSLPAEIPDTDVLGPVAPFVRGRS